MHLTYHDTKPSNSTDIANVEALREQLARELYWKAEQLDPTVSLPWAELAYKERHFWECLAEHVLLQGAWLKSAANLCSSDQPPRNT